MVKQALILAAMVGLYGCSADMSVDNPNNNRASVTTETRTTDTNRDGTASVGGTWHDNSSSYQAKDPNAPVWTDPPSHPEHMARSSDADLSTSANASNTSNTSSNTTVTTDTRGASASVAADNAAGRQTTVSGNTSSTDADRAMARTDTTVTTTDEQKKASGWSASAGTISPKGGAEVGSTAMNDDGSPSKKHAAAFDPNRNTSGDANVNPEVAANTKIDLNKDATGQPLPGARASGDVNTSGSSTVTESSRTTNADNAVTAGARTDVSSNKTSVNTTTGDMANKLKDPDDKFVKEGASSDMFEIKSSELALKVANNEADKQFAQQMIDDHKKVSDQMKSIAESKGFTVPGEMNSINKTMLDKLTAKSDNANKDDFTREYRDLQVQAHEAAVKLFQREADHGDDVDLKKLAADTLPTIKHHLEMAKSNYEQIRRDNSSK